MARIITRFILLIVIYVVGSWIFSRRKSETPHSNPYMSIVDDIDEPVKHWPPPEIDMEILYEVVEEEGAVPVAWADLMSGTGSTLTNWGDAINPYIIGQLAGLPVVHRNFDTRSVAVVGTGTIGHGLRNGMFHLWGTGGNWWKDPQNVTSKPYSIPKDTLIIAHALRGPQGGEALKRAGGFVSEVYGDPVMLMPHFHPRPKLSANAPDLCVILHITELKEGVDPLQQVVAVPEFKRYRTDNTHYNIKLLHMVVPYGKRVNGKVVRNAEAMKDKLDEILDCKRITSVSLHGMVIPETYGIPSIVFAMVGDTNGVQIVNVEDESVLNLLDHRFRDFYLGINVKQVPIYIQSRLQETNWEDLIKAIDTHWKSKLWDTVPYLNAFPLDLKPGWNYTHFTSKYSRNIWSVEIR